MAEENAELKEADWEVGAAACGKAAAGKPPEKLARMLVGACCTTGV